MSEKHDFDGIQYRIETKSPKVFRALFALLILWGLCFIAFYLFSGWSSEGEYARKKQVKQERLSKQPQGGGAPAAVVRTEGSQEERRAAGKKVYAERCAPCHGADAKGGIGPDLTRKNYKYGKTEQAVAESIAEGRPGGMPSFKNDISREKIEGLVAYLLSL